MQKDRYSIGTNPETGKQYFIRLGRDNLGNAWYLKDNGTVTHVHNQKITSNVLCNLADYFWWVNESYASYENENGVKKCNWTFATGQEGKLSDWRVIDPSKFVGVGAYRFKDNSTGFFDGDKIIMAKGGKYENEKDGIVFLRRCKLDFGFQEQPIEIKLLKQLKKYCEQMVFKNDSDIKALLGICCQMLVCGSLNWRAAGALTGPSAVGKSTILTSIVRPLTQGQYVNGRSTAAGIRQSIGPDSKGIVIDEFDHHKNKYDQYQREEIIQLMRQGTSNDSPDIVKGSQNQTGSISYRCRSQFFFAGIDPSMGHEQDENRILFIRLEEKSQEQKRHFQNVIYPDLLDLIKGDFSRRFASRVWRNREHVESCTDKIKKMFREIGVKSERRIDVWAGVVAEYFIVFEDKEPEFQDLLEWIKDREETEESENENQNILDRMLDMILRIADVNGSTDTTIRRMLLNSGSNEIILEQYGFSVSFRNEEKLVFIENANNFWEEKLGQKKYHRLFERLKYCVDKQAQKKMNSKNRRCTVFRFCDLIKE